MSLPWFRLYHEFAADPKVQSLTEPMQRRLVMLMCLHCSEDIPGLSDEEVATALRVSIANLKKTKELFLQKGFISEQWELTSLILNSLIPQQLRPTYAVWTVIRKRIFERDDFTCKACGVRGVALECDHVISVSRGGSSDDDNLVTACKPCNQSKRAKTPEEWLQ